MVKFRQTKSSGGVGKLENKKAIQICAAIRISDDLNVRIILIFYLELVILVEVGDIWGHFGELKQKWIGGRVVRMVAYKSSNLGSSPVQGKNFSN